jgi:hypothetical protein
MLVLACTQEAAILGAKIGLADAPLVATSIESSNATTWDHNIELLVVHIVANVRSLHYHHFVRQSRCSGVCTIFSTT